MCTDKFLLDMYIRDKHVPQNKLTTTLNKTFLFAVHTLPHMLFMLLQSNDFQYGVTSVIFHGLNKVASCGAADGYASKMYCITILKNVTFALLEAKNMCICLDRVSFNYMKSPLIS